MNVGYDLYNCLIEKFVRNNWAKIVNDQEIKTLKISKFFWEIIEEIKILRSTYWGYELQNPVMASFELLLCLLADKAKT